MSIKDLSLSEEDVKQKLITPAVLGKGWSLKDDIFLEVKLTDGKIDIHGNKPVRQTPKYADYVLYYNNATPLAVIEAKRPSCHVGQGLQQGMGYSRMLGAPFAYSSNGYGFVEHDFLTGKERTLDMDDFPTKDELFDRFCKGTNGGSGLGADELRVVEQPNCTGQDIFPPRYYQRRAINLTLDAYAQGQKRLLLVLATGTGKTYVAFQIIYRLLKSGLARKVLYLADRNILVDQSIQEDFRPLGSVTHKVEYSKDLGDPGRTAYQVYFSLYQQLIGMDGRRQYEELFRHDFFDLIVVDECHRGSAKEDSEWRSILEYFSSAAQLGMTATPKETKYQSNLTYFGEPLHTYSLREGIDDGFLAPFKVINIQTNIGDGWRPFKGQKDYYGHEIEDRVYNNSDYDYSIVIWDRIREVARQITNYLKKTDRMAKTIVFCASEEHAELMRQALVNANSDLCRKHPDYVVRITGSDQVGKGLLKPFISVAVQFPVIATTSKLLSTGVNCKMVKLIVLDQVINSMTEFKQIIGRGTRIKEKEGKTHFTIMDFRNVTHLFADEEWDGPLEIDKDYDPIKKPKDYPSDENMQPDPPSPVVSETPRCYVDEKGCKVTVTYQSVSIYDTSGKLLRTESITDYTRRVVISRYPDLEAFAHDWTEAEVKSEITNFLSEKGIDLKQLKEEKGMSDVDDFDLIRHLAFGTKPLTRAERARRLREEGDFLPQYTGEARQVLDKLLDKYVSDGVTQLEDMSILRVDPFRTYGSPTGIIRSFGGAEQYRSAVHNLTQSIYEVTL